MVELSFTQQIEKERNRLGNLEGDLNTKIAQLQKQLAEIHSELHAVDTYEAAKTGKKLPGARNGRGGKRSRQGGVTQKVLDAIKKGSTDRKKLIASTALSAQQVSNSLTALKKAGSIIAAKRGTYKAAKGA